MESVAGGTGGGGGSDCEGEDQDDSSSSNSQELADAQAALVSLNLQDQTQNKAEEEEEDALADFRQQWQRELVSTPSPQRQLPTLKENSPKQDVEPLPDNDEDKAKALFLRGVALERGGKLYEAVQQYKRAVQLLPDVEQRLYDTGDRGTDTPTQVVPEVEAVTSVQEPPPSDEDEELEGHVDMVARLQRILAKKGRLCEPEFTQKGGHISWLPYEVVLLILRWVVSSHLDAASLERASVTCRGLYLAARDQDIWRSLCIRSWGIECGTPRAHGYATWRDMYIERGRVHLHGAYISKTTYLRHGENAYQDQSYKPWYLIEYYRYLRFFPEGMVLMWTTADEPLACVGHLKHRQTKSLPGILSGHYRLIGDKVVIVLRKPGADKKPAQASNTRFRARRKDSQHEQHDQIFHLELQLRSSKSRRNFQLVWRGYSVCARRDQWTSFDIHPSKYPPFYFSAVRNYTSDADAPLT